MIFQADYPLPAKNTIVHLRSYIPRYTRASPLLQKSVVDTCMPSFLFISSIWYYLNYLLYITSRASSAFSCEFVKGSSEFRVGANTELRQ